MTTKHQNIFIIFIYAREDKQMDEQTERLIDGIEYKKPYSHHLQKIKVEVKQKR